MQYGNILLTGYQPFDQFDYNPSQAVALALEGRMAGDDLFICGESLPVDSARLPKMLAALIEKHQPQLIVGLGLAFGENSIRVEKLGHNWIEYSQPDNGGHVEPGRYLDPSGPAAYFSTFEAEAIVAALLDEGIPAYVSSHAGTHMCNYFLYEALHTLCYQDPPNAPRIGFIHLPATPALAATMMKAGKTGLRPASMSLDLMQEAVKIALDHA